MRIRDLDDNNPKEAPIPVEEIADEILFELGRIRDLFNRVMLRKKAAWDPATRTRQPMKKRIAEIRSEADIEKAWEIIEEDSMAHYQNGNIECWIVRFGSEKYACEVFDNGESIDAIVKRNFGDLVRHILSTYHGKTADPVMMEPPVVKRKPGRPKMEATA